MKENPSKLVTDAWMSLFKAHHSVFEYAQQTLKQHDCPPISWYDVLWELEKADERGLRPFELESLVLFKAQYSISRVITRLEKAEYVKKVPCADDGRGFSIVITQLGRKVRRDMWKIYSEVINTALGDRLSAEECIALTSLLGKLKG